jgi:glyoxylase I family protein
LGNYGNKQKEWLLLIDFKSIHHVSLSVTDLEQAKRFYGEILGLKEINRPNFDFPGAWYKIGDQQLHLILYQDSETLRKNRQVETKDGHFAIRVQDYYQTLAYLKDKGVLVTENPNSKSGFAQLFCTDPDNNLIEFNVEQGSLN